MAEPTKTPEQIKAEKEAKFKELGVKRTQNAIKAIQLIGNLGSSAYVSTEAQRKAIHEALNKAVAQSMEQLNGKPVNDGSFSL